MSMACGLSDDALQPHLDPSLLFRLCVHPPAAAFICTVDAVLIVLLHLAVREITG